MFTREQMLDSKGMPMTQGLFLEPHYSEYALFTFKDIDWEKDGKTYVSLKRLYLEMEDPSEYAFATTYLLGWKHWVRMNENKMMRTHFDEWREGLGFALPVGRRVIEAHGGVLWSVPIGAPRTGSALRLPVAT